MSFNENNMIQNNTQIKGTNITKKGEHLNNGKNKNMKHYYYLILY